ncbi:MAG: T9SS type A sorting domain-containing protein, partial [Bacteriovoracaceae bacterium]
WDTIRYFGLAGDTVQFKFRAFPVTKFENNGWEVPMPSVSHNREVIVSDIDTVLLPIAPLIFVKPPIENGAQVTFHVNMNEYLKTGRMMPADKIMLRGIHDNWDPGELMSDPEGDGIYSITIIIGHNTQFQYKFFIDAVNNPMGEWEKDFNTVSKNREASVGVVDVNLPIVNFNDEPGSSVSIYSARSAINGSTVTVEGIVTRSRGGLTRMQDATAGITIFQSFGSLFDSVHSGAVREGDQLRCTGRVSGFRSLKQIDSIVSFSVVSRDNMLPAPKPMNLSIVEQQGELFESQLVIVPNITLLTAGDSVFLPSKNYALEDFSNNTHSVALHIPNVNNSYIGGTSTNGSNWTFTGVVAQFSLSDSAVGYQLTPVNITDFVAQGTTTVQVTFQVNMREYIRSGRFSPATDSVMLRGVMNNWDPGVRMHDDDADNVYVYTVGIPANTHVEYKFWVSSPYHITDGWEKNFPTPSGNREITTGAYDMTLPVVFFDGESNLPMLEYFSVDSKIIVEVDMRPAFYFRADSGYLPNPSGIDPRQIQNVYVNGPVSKLAGGISWPAWGDTLQLMVDARKLFDDGLHDDAFAGDSIYTFTRTFTAGMPREYIGKIGVNGLDNEAAFGKDHLFVFPDTSISKMQLVYGAITHNGIITDDYGISRENPGTYDEYIIVQNGCNPRAVRFGGYPDEPQQMNNITFVVDMHYYIQQNKFSPVTDTVFLRGSFSSWDPIPMVNETLGVYSVTIPFPSLRFDQNYLLFEYKYWYRNALHPEGVYEDSVGGGEYGNRILAYNNIPMTLKVVFFNNRSQPVVGGWNLVLTVTDTNGTKKELLFGEHPAATVGLDVALGEADLPPLPPAGIFDARFLLPNSAFTSLTDLRDTTDMEKVWTFSFRSSSLVAPVTITWDNALLPQGIFILKDVITGMLVNIDMKAQNSYRATSLAITSLKIEHSNSLSETISFSEGWNMLSIPVGVPNMTVNSIFPLATSQAFGFTDGYVMVNSFLPGKGYWLKFAAAETKHLQGTKISGPVNVPGNWSMIGVFDRDVAVHSIVSVPPNIVTSLFFGFDASGYVTVDTLKTGKGYWVKTLTAGMLEFDSKLAKQSSAQSVADHLTKLGRITITDAKERSKVLYTAGHGMDGERFALPPVPPSGIYDVRYRSDSYGKDVTAGEVIDIRGAVFPIRIRVDGIMAIVQDVIGGSLISRELKSGEEMTILESTISSIFVKERALPAEYSLDQNYPNPFNPSTTISFSLPEDAFVRLTVFNVIGQEVAQLTNGMMAAGVHRMEFNARQLSSNVYFYKMEAGSFVEIKRMMLLK